MPPDAVDAAPVPQEMIYICAQMPPEFAAALVAAHGEIKNPRADSDNPHFHSRYASLAGVIDAVAPILFKHGLCQWQELVTETLFDPQGRELCNVLCTTVILHKSGAMLRFPAFKLPAQASAQGVGGGVTYARRYSLPAALGIAADDDDDGEADRQARAKAPAPRSTATQTTPTRPQGHSSGAPAGGLPLRPTGPFAYGKKYVDVPWNVMFTSQLEWFRDQATTPRPIREKCIAELAHRQAEADALEAAQARKAQDDAANPIDDNVPM